jgi:hypothetical protein
VADPSPTAELPPELERRIEALERHDSTRDLNAGSWFWLILLGVLAPAALLLWGWWA